MARIRYLTWELSFPLPLYNYTK
nr:hypothetical protein [Tanacetum cinerariifolium]